MFARVTADDSTRTAPFEEAFACPPGLDVGLLADAFLRLGRSDLAAATRNTKHRVLSYSIRFLDPNRPIKSATACFNDCVWSLWVALRGMTEKPSADEWMESALERYAATPELVTFLANDRDACIADEWQTGAKEGHSALVVGMWQRHHFLFEHRQKNIADKEAKRKQKNETVTV